MIKKVKDLDYFLIVLSTSQKDTQIKTSLSKVHMEQLEYNLVTAVLEFLSIVCSHDEDQESEGEGYDKKQCKF